MHLLCSNIQTFAIAVRVFAASDSYPVLKFHYLSVKIYACLFCVLQIVLRMERV